MNCKKITDDKYLNRPSPPYHANDCPSQIKKGNDKQEYFSKKDKNGVYKWVKISSLFKKNIDQYYKQFPNYVEAKHDTKIFTKESKDLKKDLKKIDIEFYFLKWTKETSEFEYEYFLEDNNPDKNYILYSERRLYWDARSKENCMFLQHDISKKLWPQVNEILRKYFPGMTRGIVTSADAIKIYFEKRKLEKIKEKVIFYVDIIFRDKEIKDDPEKYIKKLKISKKIGYPNTYDMAIVKKTLHIEFTINDDKIKEFKKIISEVKKNNYDIPEVKDIKVTI